MKDAERWIRYAMKTEVVSHWVLKRPFLGLGMTVLGSRFDRDAVVDNGGMARRERCTSKEMKVYIL